VCDSRCEVCGYPRAPVVTALLPALSLCATSLRKNGRPALWTIIADLFRPAVDLQVAGGPPVRILSFTFLLILISRPTSTLVVSHAFG